MSWSAERREYGARLGCGFDGLLCTPVMHGVQPRYVVGGSFAVLVCEKPERDENHEYEPIRKDRKFQRSFVQREPTMGNVKHNIFDQLRYST